MSGFTLELKNNSPRFNKKSYATSFLLTDVMSCIRMIIITSHQTLVLLGLVRACMLGKWGAYQ